MNYNKAYCIICVHRPYNQSDKTNTSVEIDIQKVKKHRVGGTPAMVPVNYNPWSTWYKSEATPRGFGALEGFFKDNIGPQPSFINEPIEDNSNLSFTAKMEAAKRAEDTPLDENGEPLPKDGLGGFLPF
jgi:hypothetical protein